jgi:hypothetical protein
MFHKTGGNMLGAASVSPYKEDLTLGDYIKRKEEAYKPKLTFEEWLKKSSFVIPEETTYEWLKDCWKAAQENM